jgi:hypothetical protein
LLFGYPIEATANNWLHDCVVEAVKNVHAAIDATKKYPAWPKILPAAFQEKLKPRTGLRDRVRAYDRAVRKLEKADQDIILAALLDQNRIPELLSGVCDCKSLEELHVGIRVPIKDLFEFTYDLLTDFEVRDQHYQAIYTAALSKTCPFCGTEYFEAPGMPREELDHYLAKSRYPFAAANLRNLVPMGHRCNTSYKLAKDLLYRDNGTRRVAFDPYNHNEIRVVLDKSKPFDGTTPNTPKWVIDFVPDAPAVQTWDEAFSIRERYRKNNLDPHYSDWLKEFQAWARSANLQANTDEILLDALRRYEECLARSGINDRAFLKFAVFSMLRRHCELGNQRLKKQLRDLVAPLEKIVSTPP